MVSLTAVISSLVSLQASGEANTRDWAGGAGWPHPLLLRTPRPSSPPLRCSVGDTPLNGEIKKYLSFDQNHNYCIGTCLLVRIEE